ncbi:MAG: hypothetical protein ABIB71_09505 [Candidatus Woesearchaeota archaeon]
MLNLEDYVVSINGPQWFFGYDVVFQAIFTAILIFVFLMSMKAYRFSEDKKFKYFGLAFLSIALAYGIHAFSNLMLYLEVYDAVVRGINVANLFYLMHIFFSLIGYGVLLLISMKVKSKRLVALLLSLIGLFIIFSFQYYLKFHLISLVLLLFIASQFIENYQKKKTFNTKLVFLVFLFLSLAEVLFIFVVASGLYYVLAYALQLIGYILMLYFLLRVVKHV